MNNRYSGLWPSLAYRRHFQRPRRARVLLVPTHITYRSPPCHRFSPRRLAKKNAEADAPIRTGRVEAHVIPGLGIATGGASSASATVINSIDGRGSHSFGGNHTHATTSDAAKGGGRSSVCRSVPSPPAAGRSFQSSLADSRRCISRLSSHASNELSPNSTALHPTLHTAHHWKLDGVLLYKVRDIFPSSLLFHCRTFSHN